MIKVAGGIVFAVVSLIIAAWLFLVILGVILGA